jgi:subtilase family serine protease
MKKVLLGTIFTILFVFAVYGQAKPDLVIIQAQVPATIETGRDVEVYITVKNQGQAPARITRGMAQISYWVESKTPPESFEAEDSYTIAPGDTMEYTLLCNAASAVGPGRYSVKFKVDPDNAIAESNEANNVFSADVVVVARAYVDLVITQLDISPAAGTPDTSFSISVSVKNQGTGTAVLSANMPLFKVDLNGERPITLYAHNATENIEPGATKTYTYGNYITNQTPGTKTWTFTPDPENRIRGSTKVNHARSVQVVISPANADLPDLVIVNFKSSPAGPNSTSDFTFEFAVKNQGRGQAAFNRNVVRWSYEIPGITQFVYDQSVDNNNIPAGILRPGDTDETVYGEISSELLKPGSYTLIIKADPNNTVSEANKENNVFRFPFTIQNAAQLDYPDLVVTGLVTNPEKGNQWSIFTARVSIKNTGTVKAEFRAGQKLLSYGFGSAGGVYKPNVPFTINPGEQKNVEFSFTGVASETADGVRTLVVSLDPDNLVREKSETNNDRGKPIEIGRLYDRPDLVITSFSVLPANPAPLDDLSIVFSVKNAGNGDAVFRYGTMSVQVFLSEYWRESGWDSELLNEIPVDLPRLAVGESKEFKYMVVRGSSGRNLGLYAFRIKVEPYDYIRESNMDNNTASKEFNITYSGRADLLITKIQGARVSKKKNTYSLTIMIKNQGNIEIVVPLKTVLIKADINGKTEILKNTDPRLSIAAGEEKNLSMTVVATKNGKWSFTLDPENVIPESNEKNNTYSLNPVFVVPNE